MSSYSRNNTWRQRLEKENAALAAENARLKNLVNNEENFPSNLVSTAHRMENKMTGFAEKAAEAEMRDVAERKVREYRQQKAYREAKENRGVFIYRRRPQYEAEEEDDLSTLPETLDGLEEKFPPHRSRRYCTAPDSDGWRLVTKYLRTKRELTEAELEAKYRAAILGEDDDSEEQDVNGDLTERNQRREFY